MNKIPSIYIFLIYIYFLTIYKLDALVLHTNHLENSNTIIAVQPPPDHKDYVAMARYVVHRADWVSLATISTIPKIKGFPFSNIVSMSDGTVEKSVGIPYFYLTPLDFTSIDLLKDNRCTVSTTLEETDYCHQKKYDADDPRCSRVMLSGIIVRVPIGSDEYDFAKEALFSRHPSMSHLPSNHNFYVAKLVIQQIVMLDWFGGPQYIDIVEYLKYNNDTAYQSSPFLKINKNKTK